VRAGQVLARLDDTEQQVELDRMMRESESTELARLARPSDEHLRAELARLRAEQELARRRLEQRGIVAPADGIVRDVRVEPGKRVDVGEVVFTFAADGTPSEDTIVALLPGGDLPLLAVGQTMRLELAGHRYAYQEAVITSVGSDVLGPAEARRLLGAQVADSLPIAGPVVVVEARAESSSFEIDGMELAYHDGMLARADARLRSERLVIALVPELRRALDWGERG
jgi:membrane fusion protein (multidrug efflux system)